MAYVIFNMRTGAYAQDKHKSWVPTVAEASKFHTMATVNNYMNNHFIHIFKEVPREDVKIVDADCIGFTEESAAIELENCLTFFREAQEIAKKLSILSKYYSHINSLTDMESQDLLHKIEFCNENVVDGYRLYKQLQHVRQRRRTAKNGFELANDLNKSLGNTIARMNTILRDQNSRKYNPRVLVELFDE